MDILLLIISLGAYLAANVVKKLYTDRTASTPHIFLFTSVGSLIAAIVLFAWGGVSAFSWFTALLGILFGTVTALQGIFHMAALKAGPLSYTTVIVSFSTLITALSGMLFFNESPKITQGIGIVLMLVSFVLANVGKGEDKKTNLKWLVFCILTFIGTGAIGIMQKVHQSSDDRAQLNEFLVIAFAVSALICGVAYLFMKGKEKKPEAAEGSSASALPLILFTVISGVAVAVNNKLNLYLSGVMESAVFFPVVNGGGLILTTLAALVLFRERLTRVQWLGVGVGILSVVFLCLG